MRAERAYAGARNYDNEGNLTKKSKGTGAETWFYGYDNLNHLTSAKQEATDGGTLLMQATYVYDPQGNRLEKDVWTSTNGLTATRFAYDNGNVWADLDGSNVLQTRRLYLDSTDSVFARIVSGVPPIPAWYLPDHLGSIRDITDDSTGAVIDHLDYDAFGKATETQSGNGDRYKWTGREFDTEIKLQYNRARYYDSSPGRWTGQDPLGISAGDANLYRYVTNGPTDAIDPSGLLGAQIDFGASPSLDPSEFGTGPKKVVTTRLGIREGGKEGGFNGAFIWPIVWRLDEKAQDNPLATGEGGIIIQYVKWSYSIEDIDRVKVVPEFYRQGLNRPGPRQMQLAWFEAWPVPVNAVGPVATSFEEALTPEQVKSAVALYDKSGITLNVKMSANDWYFMPQAASKKATKGQITIKGQAAYFPRLSRKDLEKYGFKEDNPLTGAGRLLSYPAETPGNYDAFYNFIKVYRRSNMATHNLTATWDFNSRVTVRTTAYPIAAGGAR